MKKLLLFLALSLPAFATNRFIAPTGTDSGNCTSSISPCQSIAYAYGQSSAGDDIQGANGSYSNGNMSINSPASKPGAQIKIHAVTGGVITVTGGWGINTSANNIEVDDLTATGVSVIDSSNVIFRRVRALNGTGSAGWFLQNAHDSSFFQCEIGFQDPGDGLKFFPSASGMNSNILFDGLVEHDLSFTPQEGDQHQDGVETEAVNGATIRNSKFWNTSTQGIYMICDLPNCGISNVTYENNWFGPAQLGTNAMNVRIGTNVTFRYNTYTSAAFASGMTNLQMIGNIFAGFNFGSGDFSCQSLAGASAVFQYNIAQYPSGNGCGDGTNQRFLDGSVTSHLVNPVSGTLAAWDLHLTAGAHAIDAGSPTNFPSTDIDGNIRPIGPLPDSGADEFGSSGTISPSPTALSFPSTVVTVQSSSQTATFTNNGLTTANISAVAINVGANPGDFVLVTNNCGATLAAGANCTVIVAFKPTTTGGRSATLRMSDDAPGNPHDVPLSGTGIPAAADATIAPTSLDFGSVAINTQSAAQTLTLTNNGGAILNISSIAKGGSAPSQFSFSSSCGATVPSLGGCTVSVQCTPSITGAKTASIIFNDDASTPTPSTQTIPITCTATTAPVIVFKAYTDFENGASANAITTAGTLNLASGDTVVCGAGWSGTTVAVQSVACGGQNLVQAKHGTGSPGSLDGWILFNASPNATASCVVTWVSPVISRLVACANYSGIGNGSVDQSSCNSVGCNVETTGTQNRTAQNVNTTSANELLVGLSWDNGSGNWAVGGNFNLRSGAALKDYQYTDQIVTGTGTFPSGNFATSTSGSNYISDFLAIKLPSGVVTSVKSNLTGKINGFNLK